jgi:D-3-phosphoglycerate dehydrogenase
MNILILEPIGIGLDACRKALSGHDVREIDTRGWPDEQLIDAARDADLVALTNRPLSAAVIDGLPKLKLVAVAFAGIDHVDAPSAEARGIPVLNAAGYANTAVAELVFCFMLALARRLIPSDRAIRQGGTSSAGTELKGKTLGIVGMGAIGREVARLAEAFRMDVIPFDRESPRSIEDVFTSSDYVTLHVPLIPQTKGLVGRDLLSRMKSSAFLINTARGPIVDSNALLHALDGDLIAGAALDVFDLEPPLPPDYPLLKSDKVLATPHIGFHTEEAVAEKGRITLDNIVRFVGRTQAG